MSFSCLFNTFLGVFEFSDTPYLEVDEKTTLKSWTVMETIIGVTGLVFGLILSLFA